MNALLEGLDTELRKLLREREMPSWTEPMLATLHDEPFSDEGWIYERKLDGVRILVFRRDGAVRLLTRRQKDRSVTYFEIRDALASDGEPNLIADGEIVAFDGDITSFARLQHRIRVGDEDEARRRARDVPVKLYLFDLLYFDVFDLTRLPLRTRKSLVHDVCEYEDPVRYTPHLNREGVAFWEEACEKGWEGVMAKNAGSPYHHGRSTDWLKFKCVNRQELVVGGFTDPEGEREGFGALLVGYWEGDALRYAGKVGTGYDDETLRELRSRMDELSRSACPFRDDEDPSEEGVHWIDPELVAEVGFTEWTEDGKLRHPRFLGLRHDKDPRKVVRERPGRSG